MLIYDDKLFAEIEMYVYSKGESYETSETLLYNYTVESTVYNEDCYYRVLSVDEVIDKSFDWRMNRGDFKDNEIDILDKRSWWFYRSYKTINRMKEWRDGVQEAWRP